MLVLTEPDFEDVHRMFLEDVGYEVFVVPHFYRNYAAVVGLAHMEQPDAIITQSQLNTMDGYEVCRRLKIDPMTERIPIIVHVNYNEIEDFRLLVKHIICAPADGSEILNVLERVLQM